MTGNKCATCHRRLQPYECTQGLDQCAHCRGALAHEAGETRTFGKIEQLQSAGSWWADAPRDGFSDLAVSLQHDMRRREAMREKAKR